MERTAFTAYRDKVVTNCARVIVGKDDIIEKVLVSFLCGGHVLLEDKPAPARPCFCALLPGLWAGISGEYSSRPICSRRT